MLTGTNLNEITDGMMMEFDKLLIKQPDNPFNLSGLTGAYDYTYKRVLLTQNGLNPFTYSFSFLSKLWIAKHSYQPDVYVSFDKNLFSFKNNVMREHNKGDYGMFDTLSSSIIELVFNENGAIEKVFDNLILATKTSKEGNLIVLDTYNTLTAYTELRNTGVYNIQPLGVMSLPEVGKLRASYTKSKYHIAIPGDAVVDDTLDIQDPLNLDKTRLFKQRMKGEWIVARFVYNNEDNRKLITNFIGIVYRYNAN
jgi:hypothetical protein